MLGALASPTARTTPQARPRVGLVAGWGRYPILVAESLGRAGFDVFCLGIKEHADPALATRCASFEWVGVAKVGRMVRHFQRHDVRDVTLAGKIHKSRLFNRWALAQLMPDWRTLRVFCQHFIFATKDRQDDTLLLAVVNDFASAGLTVAPATNFAPELLVKFRQLTRRAPNQAERRDAIFGWQAAKQLGGLDIGQSVVIKSQVAIAVEAIEGTDRCIERAGALCRQGHFTVVKVAKPQQDMRFDVPTIGLGTLQTMVQAGGSCLAIEAGRTIVLDEMEVVEFADQHGISIVALDAQGNFPTDATPAAA
ncbi:MAG: UDP-2,3-diacylglucosamine diphosphatase LpxI [Planctomycetes bacterium]|nr:UDP-2,3-diacylglucosamine diphosphatase LpxI [Planctomycetota bacterium]